MKARKLIMFTLTLSLLLGASSCSRLENANASGKEIIEEETNEPIETSIVVESPTSPPTPSAPSIIEESMEAYEKFLNDELKVSTELYLPTSMGDALFEAGRSYTLSDILKAIADEFYDASVNGKVDYIDYSFIDCGNDGVTELVIRFNGLNFYGDSTFGYVIKYMDGNLYFCYDFATWARSYFIMNQYGYYQTGGSGGASNHIVAYGLLGENGLTQHIVSIITEQDINQLTYTENLSMIPKVAEAKGISPFMQVDTIRFGDDNNLYYTFYVFDSNMQLLEDDTIYINSVYKDIFDEALIPFITPDEVNARIAERERQIGVTQEIKDGPDMEWITLDGSKFSEYVVK